MILSPAGLLRHKGIRAWLAFFLLVSFLVTLFHGYPTLKRAYLTLAPTHPTNPDTRGKQAIQAVCAQTTWNANLTFTCNNAVGGVGNVRNSILHCVRYAIQAGASLVLPRPVLRSSADIGTIETGQTADFSYLFDTAHFLATVRALCPQMRIHATVEDAWGEVDRKLGMTLTVQPEALVEGGVPRTGLPDPGAWRGLFYAWLKREVTAATEKGSPAPPALIVVDLLRSYMTYPIYSDGAPFALTFASILQFRNDTRVLATRVLQSLAQRFSLDNVDLSQEILPNAFFGVHLRTEADSKQAWESAGDYWVYSHYDAQFKAYMAQAGRSRPKAIYVASGDAAELKRFAADVAAQPPPNNYAVASKEDLLTEGSAELAELQALNFDQQALVDYEVLLRASDFAGVAHSSFAWSIALKRHQFAKKKGEWLDAPEMLDDDLSKLYGNVKDFEDYPNVLWPRHRR